MANQELRAALVARGWFLPDAGDDIIGAFSALLEIAAGSDGGRTLGDIRDQLLRISPWWLREPENGTDAVLRGMAAAFERVEGSIETLFARTFIDRADASWLDEHGNERSRPRVRRANPANDESDDLYRPRIKGWPDAVTRPAVLAAVNAVLVIGEARIEEWLPDSAFACPTGSIDISAFAGECTAFSSRRGFSLYIEPQAASTNDTAWAVSNGAGSLESFAVQNTGDGSYPDDPGTFADRSNLEWSGVYALVIETIKRTKAAGVAYRVYVE